MAATVTVVVTVMGGSWRLGPKSIDASCVAKGNHTSTTSVHSRLVPAPVSSDIHPSSVDICRFRFALYTYTVVRHLEDFPPAQHGHSFPPSPATSIRTPCLPSPCLLHQDRTSIPNHGTPDWPVSVTSPRHGVIVHALGRDLITCTCVQTLPHH